MIVGALGFGIPGGQAADLRAGTASEPLTGPVNAVVLDVRDGDSLSVLATVWVGMTVRTDVRLLGVDAPERRGSCPEERRRGEAARAFVVKALADGTALLFNVQHGKFAGRVLARVETAAGLDLGRALVANGLARPYDGGKRQDWCVSG